MDKPLSVKINGLKSRLDLLINLTRYDDALLLICQEVNQLVISKNLRSKGLYLPEVDSYIIKIIDRIKVLGALKKEVIVSQIKQSSLPLSFMNPVDILGLLKASSRQTRINISFV